MLVADSGEGEETDSEEDSQAVEKGRETRNIKVTMMGFGGGRLPKQYKQTTQRRAEKNLPIRKTKVRAICVEPTRP